MTMHIVSEVKAAAVIYDLRSLAVLCHVVREHFTHLGTRVRCGLGQLLGNIDEVTHASI